MAQHVPGYKPDITDTSLQGILDFVARHLYSMDGPSVDNGGSACAYRGENGRMCAVGALIADEHYKPAFEGEGIGFRGPVFEAVLRSVPGIRNGPLGRVEDLLEGLQQTHDSFSPADGGLPWTPTSVQRALECSVRNFNYWSEDGLEALTVPAPE